VRQTAPSATGAGLDGGGERGLEEEEEDTLLLARAQQRGKAVRGPHPMTVASQNNTG
jgi:hypothetical protein